MKGIENQPKSCRMIGSSFVLRAQIIGNDGIDADGEPNRNRINKILDGENKGQGSHSVLADFRHEETVNDVVKGCHHHRENHRQ